MSSDAKFSLFQTNSTSECNSLFDGCLPFSIFYILLGCIGLLIFTIIFILICWCTSSKKSNPRIKNNPPKKPTNNNNNHVEIPDLSNQSLHNVYINQAYIQDTNGQLKLVATNGQITTTTDIPVDFFQTCAEIRRRSSVATTLDTNLAHSINRVKVDDGLVPEINGENRSNPPYNPSFRPTTEYNPTYASIARSDRKSLPDYDRPIIPVIAQNNHDNQVVNKSEEGLINEIKSKIRSNNVEGMNSRKGTKIIRPLPPVRLDHFPSSESEIYSDMSQILVNFKEKNAKKKELMGQFTHSTLKLNEENENYKKSMEIQRPKEIPPPPPPPRQPRSIESINRNSVKNNSRNTYGDRNDNLGGRNSVVGSSLNVNYYNSSDDDSDNWGNYDDEVDEVQFKHKFGDSYA